MNLTDRLIKTVEEEIIKTKSFQYVPPTADPQNVDLLIKGEIGKNDFDLDRWLVSYNAKKKEMQLRVFVENQMVCVCVLIGSGFWRGRDRKTNGIVLFRPTVNEHRWKELANPTNFYKSLKIDDEDGFMYMEHLTPQFDWEQYKWNIKDNLSKTALEFSKTSKVGVAIVAYDRPKYLSRVIQSIVQNPEIKDLPVYAFLDKPEPELKHTTEEQKVFLRELIPHCVVIERPRNFGCGRNIIDARRQLFDNLGFERVFVFEDDMIISKNYIGFTMNLMDWTDKNYSNVGAVQGWFYCSMSPKDKKDNLRYVWPTLTNWWGYLMKKEAWNTIKDGIYRYEDLFMGGEYKYRPHKSIRHWFKLKMKGSKFPLGDEPFPLNGKFYQCEKRYFDDPATGQDAATMHIFHREGWVRVAPVVNRCLYIGKHGIHMSPSRFERDGFSNIILDEFDEDLELDEFEFLEEVIVKNESPVKGLAYVNSLET